MFNKKIIGALLFIFTPLFSYGASAILSTGTVNDLTVTRIHYADGTIQVSSPAAIGAFISSVNVSAALTVTANGANNTAITLGVNSSSVTTLGPNPPAASIAAGSLGSSVLASSFPATGVTAAAYTNTNLTVNAQGLITAASNGSAGGGGASTLAVGTGTASNFTTNITSPTNAVSLLGSQFSSIASGTTNFISLASSITLNGSLTVNGAGGIAAPNGFSSSLSGFSAPSGGFTAGSGLSSGVLSNDQLTLQGNANATGRILVIDNQNRSAAVPTHASIAFEYTPSDEGLALSGSGFIGLKSSSNTISRTWMTIGAGYSNLDTSATDYITVDVSTSGSTAGTITLGNKLTIDGSTGSVRMTGQFASLITTATFSSQISTINWNAGNNQYLTLTGTTTISFSNPLSAGRYLLLLKQDGTGGRTVTWPVNVLWSGGITPAVTATASKIDAFSLIYDSIDDKYLGDTSLNH